MGLVSEHTNVYRSCIALLDLKGWEIKTFSPPYDDEEAFRDAYEATKDGTVIKAENPISLLGLAALHEHHHPHGDEPYWWAVKDENNLYNKLRDEALEISFLEYWKKKPKKAKAFVRKVIEEYKKNSGRTVHERLGISKELYERIVEKNLD